MTKNNQPFHPIKQPADGLSFGAYGRFTTLVSPGKIRHLGSMTLVRIICLSTWLLSGCTPDSVENGPMPDILVTATTSEAIQAAIDAAPATGAHIILPPGDYRATARVDLTSKNRIILDGQGKANWIGSSAVPNLFAVLGTCRDIRLTGINFSTTATPGKYDYGLLCTFDQTTIDGYEIDHCQFTSPGAAINLIHFLPYSALTESGNGRGSMQRNIYIHHCTAVNGGRAFCEINSHVHADGRTETYYENVRFSHNTVTNMGTQFVDFGPALSLSGMGRQVVVDSNIITEAKYCGFEFVNVQQISATGNQIVGNLHVSSGLAFSQAGTGRNTNVTLVNNSGTVKGRAFILHDIDSFTITGGRFTASQKTEVIRARNGLLNGVSLTVDNDVNALLIGESEAVSLTNATLRMTNPTALGSVIVIPTSSQRIVVRDNTLARPARATGAFIQSETSSGNQIGPNIEELIP